MMTGYENRVLEPPLSEWSAALATLSETRLQSLRAAARRRLVQTAHEYRQRLADVGRRAGLLSESTELLTGDADTAPIVMTGHQPVILHSGLTFKYGITEEFAGDQKAIAVAVVIDTDEGEAGAFAWPEAASDTQVCFASASFCESLSLYMRSLKKSAAEIKREGLRVAEGLRGSGCVDAAAAFETVAQQYAAIETDSMMESNLIVRWHAGIGHRMLEVPLSVICSFPEVVQFFAEILTRPFEFADCYNATLNAFRSEQKIRNDANPFPNLQRESARCELPFWLVDPVAGTRSVVGIRKDGFERFLETAEGVRMELLPDNEAAAIFSLLVGGKSLVPRGALITATLRLLFSDLFVHGTGGGRYDRYTDVLIRTWWKVEPTPFAVASASRYLFDEQRHDLTQLQKISEQLRELQFNPQRYLGTGLFSAATEELLHRHLAAKEDAVSRLKRARETGQSAQEIGGEIQALGDMIKETVAQEFEPRLARLRELSPGTISAWTSRTWPWMFFPKPATSGPVAREM